MPQVAISAPNRQEKPTLPFSVWAVGIALALGTLALLAGGIWLVQIERERDVAGWERRLRIVADTRKTAIDQWLDRQVGDMRSLAENTSLQLYMTELEQAGGQRDRVAEEPAQAAYLRNLLVVTANQSGYQATPVGPQVDANVRRTGTAGIALLDARYNVVVGTPLMPPLDDATKAFLVAQPKNRPSVREIYSGAAGTPTMAFTAPVFAVQTDAETSLSIGWVLGIREVAKDLVASLQQPGMPEASAEGLLLQRSKDTIEIFSGAGTDAGPSPRTVRADAAGSVEAEALAKPGSFVHGRDYKGRDILGISQQLALPSWVLLYKVDRSEALAESNARRRNMLIALVLLAVGVDLGFVAVWRHATSKRASESAARLQELANRYEAQGNLLRLVADSQPDVIYLVDGSGHIRFLNRAAATQAGAPADDLVGKAVASTFGPEEWRRVEPINREATVSGESRTFVGQLPRETGERFMEATHVPLPATTTAAADVLVIERDVTDVVMSRERRTRSLRRLVAALVGLVDRRDPYAAQHSARVAQLARMIAEALEADAAHVEAAETAGALMNLGKILVPPELLTKAGSLTDAEREQLRAAMLSGADVVAGIEFDGPVEETLRQIYERWDGSGYPKGIAGDAILLPARIVAVANAFVGMISSRAWRGAISIDDAVNELLADAGNAFDRHVALALAHIATNRRDDLSWIEPEERTRTA